MITARAPEGFDKVFFTNGGADANENAIRMARLVTGRDKVISRYRSYHGNTGAAIVATGDWRRIPNEYARGHVHVFGPYLYRTEFWAQTPEEESERALHHLERVIQAEGPATIAAILLETIPGTAGIMVPPAGYLAGVRAIADRYGIVLILDEVMAGFGRTGQWFAFDAFDVRPDLITFAKGVNSGYVPVGGVIISDAIAHAFDDRVYPGGLTYSGHPLAAASIVAALTAMEEEGVVANAARSAPTFSAPGSPTSRPATSWSERSAAPASSGRSSSSRTGRPGSRSRRPRWPSSSGTCVARGLLPFVVDNRIHVVPPAVVTPAEARQGLRLIDEALSALGG